MANEARAGTDRGRINFLKIVKCDAPSMNADSQDIPGQAADIVVQQISRQRQAENRCAPTTRPGRCRSISKPHSRGGWEPQAICSGTTSSATTMMKKIRLPGKRIQAKP